MNRISSTVLVLFVEAMFFGCGGDKGTEPEDDLAAGKFEAQITGAFTAALSGCAAFDNQSDYFQLGLIDLSNQPASISFARGNSSVPSVGAYSVSEDAASSSPQNFIGLIFYSNGQTNETYTSDSGSMTVTASGTDSFRGTFNFTAVAGNRKITVSGKFNATRGPCK